MTNPLLSVEASPTALSGYSYGLQDVFEDYFEDHAQTQTESYIEQMFKSVEVPSEFMVAQTYMNAPLPAPIIAGDMPETKGFDELTFSAHVYDYGTPWMEWHVNSLQDEQATKSFRDRVDKSAEYLARHPRYVFRDLLTGSATTNGLHPEASFTTIFSSTGLFNDSHSFGGQTLDNSIGGRGTSFANVFDDLYTIFQTFDDMVDANGEPFWDENQTESASWCLVCPNELRKVFNQLMKGEMVNSEGGTSPNSNYLRTVFGERIDVKYHSRLTDANDYYMFRTTAGGDGGAGALKPFIKGEKKGIQQVLRTMAGQNERAVTTYMESVRWWMRRLYAIGYPHCAVEITQS